jgi:lipopolysaccharide transport system ATP-binding protein
MTIAIHVEELSKRYAIGERAEGYKTLRESLMTSVRGRSVRREIDQTIWAVKDVSFDVQEGEVLGVIGRNGAGKSTLLKILSRITEPTSGFAEVRGRVGSLLEVGTGFHPELTGRENIFLNGAILGMGRREVQSQLEEIVDFAEIARFIDTPVKRYSSGMYLRLAFSVAAHMRTDVLLVDEVLAVGDAAFQRKCLGKMKDIGRLGRTVIFVSHDMSAIINLTSTALLLEGGQISYAGSTEDAIRRYATEQVTESSDLGSRTDRNGDGIVRVETLTFETTRGRVSNAIHSGDAVRMRFAYSSRLESLNGEHVALDVRFRDVTGHPVVTMSTRFSPISSDRQLDGRGNLICEIPSLNLADDVYSVDIWLAYLGGLSDEILGAAYLEVLPGDFFGTGQAPVRRKHGAMLIEHSWRLGD